MTNHLDPKNEPVGLLCSSYRLRGCRAGNKLTATFPLATAWYPREEGWLVGVGERLKWKRIVQVGDVHWPELIAKPAYIDNKASVFPGAVIERIAYGRKEASLRLLERVMQGGDVVAVVCMGDMTSWGDLRCAAPGMGEGARTNAPQAAH